MGVDTLHKSLSQASIDEMIETLREDRELERHLPGGGYLHMSDELPYLVIYRLTNEEEMKDLGTIRFVLSEASFLVIGNQDFEGYRRLVYSLADAMAAKFKTFLAFELFSGNKDSEQFKIKGPENKLPTTLKTLKKELDKLNKKYDALSLRPTQIEDTEQRNPEGKDPLLSIKELKDAGCLLLGLEVPPVYRNHEGEEYPVFFRSFKDDLVVALHKAIYNFIRVQTSSGVTSYYALGQRNLKENVLDIDRQLAQIETSYQFLWLISPSNIRQVKKTFFDSNFDTFLNYHYRLLPVDPDVLKRKLYNLKIEKVDDPALSFLFREKREELDLQIKMLNARGTSDFFYNGLMLYKGVEKELQQEALNILAEIDEQQEDDQEEHINAYEFKELANLEFEYFRRQDKDFFSKVHVRDDVNILMVSRGELYIPSDYKMNITEARALIQHEIGTHVLTYYNGLHQPLGQLSIGLTDYDTLQEGIAVLSEYLVNGLTANRLRTLAGRVVASSALAHGADFKEIFRLLREEHNFTAERSFNIASRIVQGGGLVKDVIYLRGLVQVKKYLEEGGELEPLLIGKMALKHMPVINELIERQVLGTSRILPRYLQTEESKRRLQKLREGISLSEMIKK